MDRPRRAAGFRVETVDDELLLYDPTSNRILALNATGALLWHLCDGTRSEEEIVALLRQGYPEAAAGIPADVAAVLEKLRDAGAILPG